MNTREKNSRLPPRPQHYSFAHKILPTFFFSDPARFIELVSKGGSEYMVGLWNLLEEDFTAAGLDPIAPDGLDVELVDLGDQASLILIKMPEPQQVAEAYIAAVAYRPDTPRIARFFTMEYDESLTDGSPRAFLCEWCHHLASMHDAVRTS